MEEMSLAPSREPLDIKAHAFSGFDHVISIRESAFNRNFLTYFRWCKSPMGKGKIQVFPLKWESRIERPVSSVQAQMGPVTLNLIDSPDRKAVNVVLSLTGGHFTTGGDAAEVSIPIRNWTIRLRAELGFSLNAAKPPENGYDYDVDTYANLEKTYGKIQSLFIGLAQSRILDCTADISFGDSVLKPTEKELFYRHAANLVELLRARPSFNLIYLGVLPKASPLLSPSPYLTPGFFGYSLFIRPNQSAINFPFLSCDSVRRQVPPGKGDFSTSLVDSEHIDGSLILDRNRLFAWLLWYIAGRQINSMEDAYFNQDNGKVVSLSKSDPTPEGRFEFEAEKAERSGNCEIPPVCPVRYGRFSIRSTFDLDLGGQPNVYTLRYAPDVYDIDIDMRIRTTESADVEQAAETGFGPTGEIEVVALSSRGNPEQGKFYLRQNKENEQLVSAQFAECFRQGRLTEAVQREIIEDAYRRGYHQYLDKILNLYQRLAAGGKDSLGRIESGARRLSTLNQPMQLKLAWLFFYLKLPGEDIFTFENLRLDDRWNLKVDLKYA